METWWSVVLGKWVEEAGVEKGPFVPTEDGMEGLMPGEFILEFDQRGGGRV